MKQRVAVLMTGTYRETEFLVKLFDHMAGNIDYDLYLILRHVEDEASRLGGKELNYSLKQLVPHLNNRCFVAELPSTDMAFTKTKYIIPTGPTDEGRECGQMSMFNSVSTGLSLIRSSLRPYTHIMKTRTDYLPWTAPWVSGMLELYETSGRKIIADGLMTRPQRYPDRLDIPWQGSLSDLFHFGSVEQIFKLWDIADILPKIWTGVGETAMFRAAFYRFMSDDVQSTRRNESFLKKNFAWEENQGKESFNLVRAGVLPDVAKSSIINMLATPTGKDLEFVNKMIRTTYRCILGTEEFSNLETLINSTLSKTEATNYIKECQAAKQKAKPV